MAGNPLCIFCAVEMTLRTIFGKQVYECPRCKRRVPVEDIVTAVEGEGAAS